jgi:peptide/nickel transport system permease protein
MDHALRGSTVAASRVGRPALLRTLAALYSRRASAIGTSIVLAFVLIALLGASLAPYSLNQQIAGATLQPPSPDHWFGTDQLGRDVFSRVLYGAGDILLMAGLGTLLSVLLGTTIGLFSGYKGGIWDEAIMRLFDSLLSVPAMLLALLLLGSLSSSNESVLIVLVVVYTPIVARVVRSVVLSVKDLAYVRAARVQGESLPWILVRAILPATFPALAVESALRFSYAIFLIASLGFLGIGFQPPSANWGMMVSDARQLATSAPWALFFPAGAIAIIVIGVNLFADGLKRISQAAQEFSL